MIDRPAIVPVLACVLLVLILATIVGEVLERRVGARPAVANLRARVAAWWAMVALLVGALALGRAGVVGLFALISFQALRELATLLPTRRADHAALVWAFYVGIPVQYGLLWTGRAELFAVFLPVAGLIGLSVRTAFAGDPERFLARIATLHSALLIGVYCPSHVPGVLLLRIPGFEGQEWKLGAFLVIVTQASDVLQFLWGTALGRTLVLPTLSPSKTVEGLVGGVLSATALGALLADLTPFSRAVAAGLAFGVAVAGFCGGAVLSAIKRDAGVKDYGALLAGHGGILDRIDSLVFSAPLFLHAVRWLAG